MSDRALVERCQALRLLLMDVDGVLTDGRILLFPGGLEGRAFHARDGLALVMARTPWLSRRAIAGASKDPRALSKLLGINCGYQTFAALTPRDWLSLAGI